MTETRFEFPQPVDILAIEREARRLRARAVAEMAQAAFAWLRARLARSPEGRRA
jgi:aryl-alcohol dehydrogenase-like predicted oxidoreductase